MGFSVLRIWPMSGSVFRFSQLKTAVFRFWDLPPFADFLEFSLCMVFGFRPATMMAVFRIFLSSAIYGFSGFCL